MPTIKTADLVGPALDWAVAKAADRLGTCIRDPLRPGTSIVDIDFDEYGELQVYQPANRQDPYTLWGPSTDWSQGGPIIDAHDIDVLRDEDQFGARLGSMRKHPQRNVSSYFVQRGPTKLVAAMRCLVASRLGDTVEIPAELLAA